jgi:poly-gamma-glutamate capsule biosynthesis protein CapA/YwtB (metallophosphatase superfamily)
MVKNSMMKTLNRWAPLGLIVAGALVTGALVRGQGAAMGDAVLQPITHDVAKELAMKITEPFTFAAVGDIIIRRPVGTGDAGYQALTKVMRDADMTYANMEGPILDEATFRGPLAGGPKSVVDELKIMGVRIMTTANNHTMDAGDAGMYETGRLLDEAGIVHAGSGRNLADAREARIAVTKKGTVAAIGMYSIDASNSPEPSRYFDATNNKAGLNPLHVNPFNVVTAEQMLALKKIRDSVYARRGEVTVPVAPISPNEPADRLQLFRAAYKVGTQPGNLTYEIDQNDLKGIVASVRTGKQLADFMIVAIHCHQNSFAFQAYSHDNQVPDFLIQLAHTVIDNGADVFVAHGVHTLRGVEIYKGKPIFYGVSNFFYHQDASQDVVNPNGAPPVSGGAGAQTHQPDDMEALLATARFEGGKLVEARLHPVDLGIEHRTTSKAGIPTTPTPEISRRILEKVQGLSKRFGTTIAIENGVGVIRVTPASTQ